MIKVKEITDYIEQIKALLMAYDQIKNFYPGCENWIAKVLSDLTVQSVNGRRVYGAFIGDVLVAVLIVKESERKICTLVKNPRFKNVHCLEALLNQVIRSTDYWSIEIPKAVEDKYEFLKKFYGFEKGVDIGHSVVYEYGSLALWLENSNAVKTEQ